MSAFLSKDARISVSYKLQFVFQFLQIFFSVMLIYFIGQMLGQSGKEGILNKYGADYFSFALIGLAVNSYLKAGLINVTNDIRQTMNQGTLESMCATPIKYPSLILYSSLWQFAFETIRVACYFSIAILLFGMRLDNINWAPAIVSMLLTAPIFLMLGIISCSILVVVKRGDPINWIFSSLGALLAGTMFPVSVLPSWLQKVSFCLPLTHSLEATRMTMLAGAGFSQVGSNLLVLSIFMATLIPITIYSSNFCMRLAKKQGAFSTH